MRARPAKSFTVEFKNKRKPQLISITAAAAEMHRADARDATGESLPMVGIAAGEPERHPGSEAARSAADALFRRIADAPDADWRPGAAAVDPNPGQRQPGQTAKQDREVVASASAAPSLSDAPAGRVLPDLLSEDPLAALLREKAAKRRTRRRAITAEPVADLPQEEGLDRPEAADIASGQVLADGLAGEDADIANGWEPTDEPLAAVPPRREAVIAASRPSRAGLYNNWAYRAVHRATKRSGAPDAVRAGERWKRRLPPVCR